MSPERHRQIGQLFDEALKRSPDRRAEFLQRACAGDDELRIEVESLLDSHRNAGDLFDVTAFEIAAKALSRAEGEVSSLVGRHIGGYQILSLLGRGGMGEVYCARDTKLERDVALKVMTNTVAGDQDSRLRFEEEARLPSRLNHVNIVTIYGVGEESNLQYIAMEFVRGRTLRQILSDGAIPVNETLHLATQIVDALAAAHAGGVVHRDLKPENIMVTPERLVKVLDFGLAKRQIGANFGRPPDNENAVTRAPQTHVGAVLGTVGYMSPEQAAGRKTDHATDQFSFGVILHEMLTGRRAFERETDVETLYAILREQPAPLQNLNAEVTAPLQDVVNRCLAKEPSDRYSNAQQLAALLRDIQGRFESVPAPGGAAPVTATRNSPSVKSQVRLTRRQAIWLGGAASLAMITSFGVWKSWPAAPRIRSVAVFPFENPGKDAESEFLSHGLTNSLIRKITGLPSLTVKRGSSHEANKAIDPRVVGQHLQVDAIVTGSVSQRSGKLFVTAELVDMTSGAVLWADRYERNEVDVALIQDEIASAIVDDGIRLKLSTDDRSRLTRHFTDDPEAYKLYMRASYLHTKVNEEDYLRARDLLLKAVDRDKKFALAYVELSFNYSVMVVDGYEPPHQGWPLATDFARKALELDPTLLEAHSRLGAETFFFKRQWKSALKDFEIGLRSPEGLNHGYTVALWAVGRTAEALRVVRKDLEQNPLNLDLRLREADLLTHLNQTDVAANLYAEIIRDEPSDMRGHFGLAEVRRVQERFGDAIDQLRQGLETASGNTPLDTSLQELFARAQGAAGYREVERVIAEIELDNLEIRSARDMYVSPLDFGRAHARLGNKTQAFDYLNAALEDRSPGLMFLKVDRAWDAVRSDPQFEEVVRRVGLP